MTVFHLVLRTLFELLSIRGSQFEDTKRYNPNKKVEITDVYTKEVKKAKLKDLENYSVRRQRNCSL